VAETADKRTGRGPSPTSAATEVRRRVLTGGERHWRLADFPDLSATAVAHALSRIAAGGELQRVRKGLYYRPKMTAIGPSMPSASAALAQTFNAPLHPAGLNAASALGLTTQNPGRGEFATPAAAAPGAMRGAVVHTRRPPTRFGLSDEDGALLELLRDRASTSDLDQAETLRRLLERVARPSDFRRLTQAALAEPPRVRAMLGALGQQAGAPARDLSQLRASLNPISRFDFGVLAGLAHAREWQAK
jgi:Family of unknown function (DUF6088)